MGALGSIYPGKALCYPAHDDMHCHFALQAEGLRSLVSLFTEKNVHMQSQAVDSMLQVRLAVVVMYKPVPQPQ